MRRAALLSAALLISAPALAVPYAVPEPSFESCRSERVMQDLTDQISNGQLRGEENLLLSLSFVQSCQDLLHPNAVQSPLPAAPTAQR